ncbi:RbsD/FucU family protein [Leptothrix discophora]|uniref:RbsD/FucU domain-containing protein n=1 Tax=Leptothrix discophora TaxID=89 RepID=A0ABT9G1R6_LEPDI|nr:RbsD/FucU domain-containing protein [Leptothrix discophora]MDP4300430.1 RbsD/FucU domain-containing protein [Leptothrix discophora]
MLKGIDPLISPDLLKVLADMGHGDEIVIADANFTAASLAIGPDGVRKPLVHLPGAGILRTVQAVMGLLPLDVAVEQPVAYMHVSGQPEGYRSRLQRDVVQWLDENGHARPGQCQAIERFAFYDRVRTAYAIVLTSDLQPYGNVILKKGVIGEALEP